MTTLQVVTLNSRGEDVVAGTISINPTGGVQIDPPDSILLQNMVKPFKPPTSNKILDPRQGQSFIEALPKMYSSAYLRAIPIPDQQVAPGGNALQPPQTPTAGNPGQPLPAAAKTPQTTPQGQP